MQNIGLLLIDLQQGFNDVAYWGGARNHPQAERVAGEILNLWRTHNLPIFHIRHDSTEAQSPLNPSHPGNAFQDVVKPQSGEAVIAKSVNSAFIGTDLKQRLDAAEIDTIVIVGLTTDHCVSTTTRMAGNLGLTVYLVNDAIATFDKRGYDGKTYPAQLIHDSAMASLHGEFATVVNAQTIEKLILV